MRPLLSNRFQAFDLTEDEDKLARQVSPLFFAFLQNKIAAYASAVVEFSAEGRDLTAATIRHERLKAQVEVLEELMQELTPPAEYDGQSQPNSIL
jgi:hypothetical protein